MLTGVLQVIKGGGSEGIYGQKKKKAKTQGCAAFRELMAGADGATARRGRRERAGTP